MKRLTALRARLRDTIWAPVTAAAILAASLALVAGEDAKTDTAKGQKDPPSETRPAKKPAKKKLTGAELYTINCNRCHPERYATEFTPSQWKTIMLHMRVRANLPAEQAKTILKYLQEDAGTP
jgi:mono/diheme cytochrome c family protein